MGLSLRYLVPLNLLIITIWLVHVAGSLDNLEKAMIETEVEASEQLAVGLKLHVEHMVRVGEKIGPGAPALDGISERWPGLDIMIIDRQFTVLQASDPTRIGRRWYETGIESVFQATAEAAWNVEGHAHEGQRAIDVSVGVTGADEQIRYVVHIAKFLDRLLEAIHIERRNALVFSILELLAVAVVVNVLTVFLVLRPLKRIRRMIHDSGWLDEHPQPKSKDEIGHMKAVVGTLLDQVRSTTERLRTTLGERENALQEVSDHRDTLADTVVQVKDELADTEARLMRAKRITAQAQLSQALAHELRNPLHIIRATAEAAVDICPEVADLTTDIMEEVDRVNHLITRVLAYTRPSDIHHESIDVGELLESVRSRMCRGRCEKDPSICDICTVTVDDSVGAIDGDPVLLEQALFNLLTNAHDASPEHAPIELAASHGDDDTIDLTVADRGPGIAEEDQGMVFEPFFTRKTTGVGLGLPAVQKIVDLHEGSITLEARSGGGTRARLRLPAQKTRDRS